MAKRPSVPKFGTWDSENVGYTVYFEKVRENKGATAPPLHRPYNPNDPEDNPRMSAPPSRPATSSGHSEPQKRPPNGQHRRAGSNSSAASDPGGMGAEQSKFAPPPQYHPRPGPHHRQPPAGHGGGGHTAPQAPRHQQVAPRARSASPQNNAPNRQRPSAVPKFGVWDEQNAAAAQGFTVQFENVKRHREVARAAVPDVPRMPLPESAAAARRSRDTTFLSKFFFCVYCRCLAASFLPPESENDESEFDLDHTHVHWAGAASFPFLFFFYADLERIVLLGYSILNLLSLFH